MKKLNYLIEKGQMFSSEYQLGNLKGTSNHLPMCLYARSKIGATDDELVWFYEKYIPKLELKNTQLQEIRWQEQLGKHEFNSEYLNFFTLEMQKYGTDALLREYLPLLFRGVGGGAFHPLIRLAYAIEMDSKSEVVEALASWAMGYLPLTLATPEIEGTTAKILEKLSSLGFDKAKYQTPGVFNRMEKASQDSLFQENIRVPFDLDLKSLADAAIQVFLSCPSFACIHLVTSTHALRHVIPFVGQTNDTLKHFWLAFAAVFVSEGAPNMKTPIVTKSRSWGELSKQAIESENDHWCKFVYTCMEEEKHYKSPFYLQAANLLLD